MKKIFMFMFILFVAGCAVVGGGKLSNNPHISVSLVEDKDVMYFNLQNDGSVDAYAIKVIWNTDNPAVPAQISSVGPIARGDHILLSSGAAVDSTGVLQGKVNYNEQYSEPFRLEH